MPALPSVAIASIAQALDEWFRAEGKDYPWRRTRDPYAILVSELMLQQTQISTVLGRGYYDRWMAQFPDVKTLAGASESAILKAWEGLGYYRRARFLQKAAQAVQQEYGGVFPQSATALRALPGVGSYTAGAVSSFAFDLPEPLVDGNVARVLTRLYDDATPIDSTQGQKKLWGYAKELLQMAPSPRRHNSALMELGQTVCKPGVPLCQQCVVQTWCQAKNPENLPVKGKQTQVTEVTERVFFQQSAAGLLLLEQEQGARRTGLWKLPALPESIIEAPVLHKSRYTITRYRVTLWVHAYETSSLLENQKLIPIAEAEHLPMPSPYRRALHAVQAQQGAFSLEG